MQLDTTDFLIEFFLCKQEKTFFMNFFFKYFARVLQRYSTKQVLQNLKFDFNSI